MKRESACGSGLTSSSAPFSLSQRVSNYFTTLLARSQHPTFERTVPMKMKFTDAAIQSYKPRAKGHAIGDEACRGLRIRITPQGVKSFTFDYRSKVTRKTETLTLGRYPDLPLAKAREAAD